ncbi:glomulin [Sceloporus undulatus]|uniref:glomulin n=1 Tax=Sceloporus undulatus TaxID=8520 RepID=UPI001C4B3993|nr:glomulin [Sceloporus undulatus]XP_042318801.1 glomulin [Sceloporus undulatus]
MAEEELRAIIQRCQILDEEEFKAEDFNLFQVAGQKCLDEDYVSEVLEVVENEKNRVIVRSMGWNLIGPLMRCMLKHKEGEIKRKQCLKILEKLVELCSPKELVLGFLEQIERTSQEQVSQIILILLDPLHIVLLKLGSKKAYSVGLSLSTILSQLSHLPVPYTKKQLEEDEHGLCQCCNALPCFVRPFVDEVVLHVEDSSDGDCKELKKELLAFCLNSIKYPLLVAELDDVPEEGAKNPFRQFAADILDILQDIRLLFPKMFSQYRCRSDSWDDDLSETDKEQHADSFACLSYMVFVQNSFGVNCFPLVFSPSYILQCNMVHIRVLLNRQEEPVLSKGLALLENCLMRLENNSLLTESLDFKVFVTTSEDLVKVATMCPFESLRKKSIKVLQLCIDKFEEEGKYILFRCLLQTSNHSGVEGFIIQNIKNQIDLALRKPEGHSFFIGLSLIKLLDRVLLLPEGASTDLLQNSDRIMAALNLLRYIFIIDKEAENRTCVWTELFKIQQTFMKPLHTGLCLSRAHYKAEIKNRKENKGESSTSTESTSITVGGKKMAKLTSQMELQVLQSALVTFDLMESILARVEELTDTLAY